MSGVNQMLNFDNIPNDNVNNTLDYSPNDNIKNDSNEVNLNNTNKNYTQDNLLLTPTSDSNSN